MKAHPFLWLKPGDEPGTQALPTANNSGRLSFPQRFRSFALRKDDTIRKKPG